MLLIHPLSNAASPSYIILIVLQEAQHLLNLDGIYVIGHSNGGNMAAELACKTNLIDGELLWRLEDGIVQIFGLRPRLRPLETGLVSIAGFELPENCSPDHPVSATLVHGTLDNIVLFESSEQALRGWLALDHCPNTTSLRSEYTQHDNDTKHACRVCL